MGGPVIAPLGERHPFDEFFEAGGYQDGQEPQAFADWLASLTGERVVGLSVDGAVEATPPGDGAS